MEMTIFPASWSAWARAVGDRGVPDGGEDDQVGGGGVVVGARLEARDPIGPALAQLVDDLCRPGAVPRTQRHPVPGSRQPGRDPPPRRTRPPQHADVHARELRTAPPRSPSFAPTPCRPHHRQHPSVVRRMCGVY